MTLWRRLAVSAALMPVVMGIVDGILTALTLAGHVLLVPERSLTLAFSLRVAAGALFSGAFVYLVSKYAELRQQLAHAERELSLARRGQLAVTALGRGIAREAALSAAVASTAAFAGALAPLCVAVALPRYRWAPIATALIALALLGAALAKMLYGSVLRWAVPLVAGGALLTYVGVKLAIL